MSERPTTALAFAAIARKLADTGAFRNAEQIRHVLTIWRTETQLWWSETLAAEIEMRCRARRTRTLH